MSFCLFPHCTGFIVVCCSAQEKLWHVRRAEATSSLNMMTVRATGALAEFVLVFQALLQRLDLRAKIATELQPTT
jgi:hypothetical protein